MGNAESCDMSIFEGGGKAVVVRSLTCSAGALGVHVYRVGNALAVGKARCHCELVGSKKVGLGAGSTTIPCEVHTISGGLHFCGQSIQDQVEIFEVGKKTRTNPGGLAPS